MALLHLDILSKQLSMSTRLYVMLPDGKTPARGYKTLYLLHGAGDDYTGWSRMTNIERYALKRSIAVVLPDAELSMYENMAHGERYMSYIAEELPVVMREYFPLSHAREDTYIAGASMGGMGALKLGMLFPENYSAIGALSTGYSNYMFREPYPGTPRALRYECAYGDVDIVEAEAKTLRAAERIISENLPAPRVFMACGKSDALLKNARVTRDFLFGLAGNPFKLKYVEAEGAHDWDFWDEHIKGFIDFALDEVD